MRLIGIFMIVISCLMFGSIFVVPFLHIAPGYKLLAGSLLTINGEILFWFGTGIIGRDVLKKIWHKIIKRIKSVGLESDKNDQNLMADGSINEK